MKSRFLPAVIATLTLIGCRETVLGPPSGLPESSAGVPQQVVVGGVPVALETSLWRDFMPIAPPDGQALTALLTVRSQNGTPLPDGLQVTAAGVYYLGKRWTSEPESERGYDPTAIVYLARGGPRWGPGGTADVIVLLDFNGAKALLRAANQPITRTD
ncbi:MAG: hypothetical protein HY076_08435 [Candidatus Eisenbacteria bacterium]|uniref:Lipoprotein n=1 Tax=Eiseniibacteriota bacterium TaxID=2212470 RepID=A0A9D6LCP0_UNCEI|nr:hypothetical protein [Candidatus Eisenbacteria bacterium]MBI3540284.1 hypothetical protein [Candidatus Eisenbacteria bacterium]